MLDGVEICKSAIYSVQSTERVSDTYLQYFQKKSYNCILKKKLCIHAIKNLQINCTRNH